MKSNPDIIAQTVFRLHPQTGAPVNLRCLCLGNRPRSKPQGRKTTAVTGGHNPSSEPEASGRAVPEPSQLYPAHVVPAGWKEVKLATCGRCCRQFSL